MRACRRRPAPSCSACPNLLSRSSPFTKLLTTRSSPIVFLLSLLLCTLVTQFGNASSLSAATAIDDCQQIRREVELPSGLVAADIVSTVEENREAASGNTPLSVQAALSGELGPSFIIGGAPPVEGNDQYFPAVAFDGTNYLVVWMSYTGSQTGRGWDILGTRVTTLGTVLDPSGIAVAALPADQHYPALAFDGANYLVVWMDKRSGAWDIYGARVNTSGSILDPGGFPISAAQNDQYWPAVGFDATSYLVLWADFRSGSNYDIYGARVGSSGSVLDPGGFAISTASGDQYWPVVAFDGTNYMAVWADSRSASGYDIYGARVNSSGGVLDTNGIAISAAQDDQYVPAIAFGGTNYLVVWADKRVGTWDIYGARVTTSGGVLDSSGVVISRALNDQYWPGIAFDGSKYMVVWEDNRDGSQYWDIYAAQVYVSGMVRTPEGIPISRAPSYQRYPTLAAGSSYLLLITYQGIVPCGIYGAYLVWGNIWTGTPTALTFSSASVSGKDGCVTLAWQMEIDVPAFSFVVQRSESRDGEFVTLSLPINKCSGLSFSCTDYGVIPGNTYWYKILLLGASGEEPYGPIEAYVEPIVMQSRAQPGYPNPFKPACTIPFQIPEACRVSLRVFDVSGALVRTLLDEERPRGAYREIWDGRDEHGFELPSGIYFYSVETSEFTIVHKIVMLR